MAEGITLDVGNNQMVRKRFLAIENVSVRNFVCELIYKSQGTRSLVCERPS